MPDFKSMKDLWNETWASRDEGETELKKAGFPVSSDDHELGEIGDGRWHLRKPLAKKASGPKPGRETLRKKAARMAQADEQAPAFAQEPEPKKKAKAPAKKERAVPKLDAIAREGVELAKRKQGVPRPDLLKLNDNIGWKSYLARYGKREGLRVEVEKNKDDVIVYKLVK